MAVSWNEIRERAARPFHRADDERDHAGAACLSGLHWMTAGLFLAAGAEAVLGHPRAESGYSRRFLRWAPLAAAPLAGAAHVARALHPGRTNRTAARVLDALAVGVGIAGIVGGAADLLGLRERLPGPRRGRGGLEATLAPLTFGATGILGLLLEKEEQEQAEQQRRLERRASIVERLVPRRRPRLDRIVVHI